MVDAMPLWPSGDPAQLPTLTFHPASGADRPRATVLVCPGGAYRAHADHEGPAIADWLNDHGLHAAVLRYRLAPSRHPAMIHDAQRAMRMLRDRAEAWRIDADAIAVLGFSAGGHLAATLAVHHSRFRSPEDDLAAKHSAKPNAAVLCYAVIEMLGAATNVGSRENLLGENQPAYLLDVLSAQRHVDAQTPPTFLWHTADDAAVPVANSLEFAAACRQHGVPVELHVYESGRHGLGLAPDHPDIATWAEHCLAFLHRHLGVEAGVGSLNL